MADKDAQTEVEDKEPELIITEVPPKETEPPVEDSDDDADDGDAADDGERRLKRSDNENGDEDPEVVRERRRKEKKERKERREAAIRRTNLEMDFLRKRNDDLERRLDGVTTQVVKQQVESIDAEITKAQREIQMAGDVMAKAIAAQNGDDATKALHFRDQARDRLAKLQAAKEQQGQEAEAQPQQRQPQVDPRIVRHAQDFASKNAWYDPTGRNTDSLILMAVDREVLQDGFDPSTPEYWAELRKRGAKRLPERFKAQQSDDDADDDDDAPAPQRKPKGGPALAGGKQTSSEPARREIYISPERKQALVDAGVWDDPILRAKYVKRYAAYDKEHKK